MIRPTVPDCSIVLQVLAPSGAEHGLYVPLCTAELRVDPPTSGRYTLVIYGSGAHTGRYGFTLGGP